ncbi:MAG: molybdate ABC transporter substrate-binding protein [Planctomycetes bacterium]|nr:molybdate ABC transporter substrate-binding protein [Planctomycetota bacterium]
MRSIKLQVILGSAAVVAVLGFLLVWAPGANRPSGTGQPLVLYCAAGMNPPVAEIIRDYENQFGVTVAVQYGGSGTLLSNLRVAKTGDLYLAADASFIEIAREQGLIAETIPLATLRPVIAALRGNPRKIQSARDLLREDVRVALGSPDAASIGKQTQTAMTKVGLWENLRQAVQTRGVFKPTVNDIANDIKIGTVDAGVVWDAVARQYPELEIVAPLTDDPDFVMEVMVAVLRSSRQPTEALRFARYLSARDKGLVVFTRHHYTVVEGDVWAREPQILLFSGSVNRPAIESTLNAFEQREGCKLLRVYNGCGILVAQMKAGARPDVYFACDSSFVPPVQDLFLNPMDVSEMEILIAVPKGNPRGIGSLADLAKEGLKLGVANAEQSALGALTERMLEAAGLLRGIMANVRSQTPTGDLLVNQLRAGGLDAVIVYEANLAQVREHLDFVRIDLPGAKAIQPYAIARDSRCRHLAQRLLDAVTSAESQEKYRKAGFRWLYRRDL